MQIHNPDHCRKSKSKANAEHNHNFYPDPLPLNQILKAIIITASSPANEPLSIFIQILIFDPDFMNIFLYD